MSGRVPPSSRANKRAQSFSRARSPAVRKAATLYEKFTGHDAWDLGEITVPDHPKAVAMIGECDGVLYTTVRDGREESYIHEFAKGDKPILCVTPDGRQILLIGGRYLFTERGIVDRSDTANLPKKRR